MLPRTLPLASILPCFFTAAAFAQMGDRELLWAERASMPTAAACDPEFGLRVTEARILLSNARGVEAGSFGLAYDPEVIEVTDIRPSGILLGLGAEERVVYASDFSADPGWTTNDPDAFRAEEGAFRWRLRNGAEQYAFLPIPFDPDATYRLAFDVLLTRCDWAADLVLGIGDADMEMSAPATWFVSYHRVDEGRTATLIAYDGEGGRWHPGGRQPAPFELGVWYHTEVLYDGSGRTIELDVTRKDDGTPVGSDRISGLGRPEGLDRIYMSSVAHTYASGATAEGLLDNLVLVREAPGDGEPGPDYVRIARDPRTDACPEDVRAGVGVAWVNSLSGIAEIPPGAGREIFAIDWRPAPDPLRGASTVGFVECLRAREDAPPIAIRLSVGGTSVLPCTEDGEIAIGRFFRRGDANEDGGIDIADAVRILAHLFVPDAPDPACEDAMDVDDDGTLGVADAIHLLSWLFSPSPSPPPPPPGPARCGVDATEDGIPCEADQPACAGVAKGG